MCLCESVRVCVCEGVCVCVLRRERWIRERDSVWFFIRFETCVNRFHLESHLPLTSPLFINFTFSCCCLSLCLCLFRSSQKIDMYWSNCLLYVGWNPVWSWWGVRGVTLMLQRYRGGTRTNAHITYKPPFSTKVTQRFSNTISFVFLNGHIPRLECKQSRSQWLDFKHTLLDFLLLYSGFPTRRDGGLNLSPTICSLWFYTESLKR